MCVRQFNILLAQAEGKKPANREQVYISKAHEHTPDEIAELQRIRNGYDRLKNEAPRTRGEQTRMAITGSSTPSTSAKVVVETIAKKIGKH
jgi:hypothetical protein